MILPCFLFIVQAIGVQSYRTSGTVSKETLRHVGARRVPSEEKVRLDPYREVFMKIQHDRRCSHATTPLSQEVASLFYPDAWPIKDKTTLWTVFCKRPGAPKAGRFDLNDQVNQL